MAAPSTGSALHNKLVAASLWSMIATERRSLVLRGVLDLCILSLLRKRPVYGYELTERLAEQDLLVSGGSVYPLLSRLEKAGLVTSEKRPSPTGPPRKYYSLTQDGIDTLDTGTAEWLSVSTSVTAILRSTDASHNDQKEMA